MRRLIMKPFLVALLVIIGGAAVLLTPGSENVVINNDNETINATLYRPFGPGPFPAVVLLHGCAGVLDKHTGWARQLSEWGYAALIVDSFSTGGSSVCARPMTRRGSD